MVVQRIEGELGRFNLTSLADRVCGVLRTKEQPFYIIPEGEGIKFIQNIGGKSAEQLEAEVRVRREVTVDASEMLHSPKFKVLKEVTPQELLKVLVTALGLPDSPTTRELFERIPRCRYGNYALEVPRAEVGAHLGIADEHQPVGDFYSIMHKPIPNSGGLRLPLVFEVGRYPDGRRLGTRGACPAYPWGPGVQLVVALRQVEPVKP